jgi:hypothetical protein
MHPRTEEILQCLDSELARLRAAVDAVPAERRSERPAADRWSVAEVLEHLARSEAAVLKACVRQMEAANQAGLAADSETTSIRHTLPPEQVANRQRRVVAPEKLHPQGIDAAAAWSEIERTRARFLEFVKSCDGLALGEISFPHPVFGPLNMYQWLLFAAGHHARHAAQIREIAQQLT